MAPPTRAAQRLKLLGATDDTPTQAPVGNGAATARTSARLSTLLVVQEKATPKPKAPAKTKVVAKKSSKVKAAVTPKVAKSKTPKKVAAVKPDTTSDSEPERQAAPKPAKITRGRKKRTDAKGPSVQATEMIAVTRPLRAPNMDGSEEEEDIVAPKKTSKHSVRTNDEEESTSNASEAPSDEDPAIQEDERREDTQHADHSLTEESAVWTAKRTTHQDTTSIGKDTIDPRVELRPLPRRYARKQETNSSTSLQDTTSAGGSPPPHSVSPTSNGDAMDDDNDYMDVDGIMDFAMTASLDTDNEQLIKQSLGGMKRKKTGQLNTQAAQKLRQELPQVSNQLLPTSRHTKMSARPQPIAAATPSEPSPAETSNRGSTSTSVAWIERTAIVLLEAHTSTYHLANKSQQNSTINALLTRSFHIGHARLLFSSTPNPFTIDGLEQISWDALQSAAVALNLDGPLDVGQRLKDDDFSMYGGPLKAYALQRITEHRSGVKKLAMTRVPGELQLDPSPAGVVNAARLLQDMAYIYGPNPDGSPNFNRPFKAPVVLRCLQSGAFLKTGQMYKAISANTHKLMSTSEQHPLELEIPLATLVLTCTAIHNIILEYARGGQRVPFSVGEMGAVYTNHLTTILTIYDTNPGMYHTLMHGLYRDATGIIPLATHGLTTETIVQRSKWDTELDL